AAAPPPPAPEPPPPAPTPAPAPAPAMEDDLGAVQAPVVISTDTDVRKVDQVQAPVVTSKERIGREVKKQTEAEIEEVLADLFQRTSEIFDATDARSALAFVLDLAMEKIPSDSGSVYRANISAHELTFAAARGPKADELLRLDIRVPVGTGLAGVCVQEGVGIAISDAHRDPRFFQAVSDKLGYEVKSVITVPIQHQGQVMGAVQLINRKKGTSFSVDDLSVLNYLAREAADYLVRTGEVTV
ncbi:MAG: GAF domain-containing protein, partial [Deltaproteobacteria bacterium]|nr:GAF domain-containing protein [Deltaproteobacteria bacterium]